MAVLSTTDLRLLFRSLARNPLFALLVATTLGAGVGATAATFTYLEIFLWDNITPDPARLLFVSYTSPNEPIAQPMGYPDFLDFRREAADFANVSAWWIWGQGVRVDDKTTAWVWGHSLSDGYFESLRAKPAAGRLFLPEDHRAGAVRAAVLGHRFWRRQYDSAPDAIGRSLEIGGQSYTIVGVTGERFIGTGVPADLYIPLQYTRDAAPEWDSTNRDPRMIWGGRVWAMARLANGVARREAQERLKSIALELDAQRRLTDRKRALDFGEEIDPQTKRQIQSVLRLLAGAGLLLVLANVNVASLLVARYLNRRRDMSILVSLGASPGRIARLLVAEGLLLSLLGGVLGIVFSRLLASILRRIILAGNPVDLGRWSDGAENSILPLDWRVVAFAFAASVVTTLLFGLLPALKVARADRSGGLRSMTAVRDRATSRTQYALVAAQAALAVVLSAGAGLLLRSIHNLGARRSRHRDAPHRHRHTRHRARAEETSPICARCSRTSAGSAAAIAGVEDATLSDPVPLWGLRSGPIAVAARRREARSRSAGGGRALLRGDPPTNPARSRHRRIATRNTGRWSQSFNQELARIFWPLTDPVGQSLPLSIPRLGIARRGTDRGDRLRCAPGAEASGEAADLSLERTGGADAHERAAAHGDRARRDARDHRA